MVTVAITVESDQQVVQDIYDYCSQHDQHGIHMCHGRYLVVDGAYWVWRIEAEPSKYLDVLLLRWSQYLSVM